MAEEIFKTTLMGGYDKADVNNRFKTLKDECEAEKAKLKQEIEQLKKELEEKDKTISEKNEEIDRLKGDIQEKYQGYVDNYDTIGRIVYETRLNADKTLKDAKDQSEQIVAEANKKAQVSIDKAQLEVEKKLADGKRRYSVLQEEVNELIQAVNKMQHKFMQSFKAIHSISNEMNNEMPESDVDAFDSFDEEDGDDEQE